VGAVVLTALLARGYENVVRRSLGWDAVRPVGSAAAVAGQWLDVQQFALYAVQRVVAPDPDTVGRERAFAGLRQLAAALAEIASHRDAGDAALSTAVARLLDDATAVDGTSMVVPAPLAARRVIDRAVDVAARLQRDRFPNAATAVTELREASWMVSPTRALRDQRVELDSLFLSAVGVLRAMGAPLPPAPGV